MNQQQRITAEQVAVLLFCDEMGLSPFLTRHWTARGLKHAAHWYWQICGAHPPSDLRASIHRTAREIT